MAFETTKPVFEDRLRKTLSGEVTALSEGAMKIEQALQKRSSKVSTHHCIQGSSWPETEESPLYAIFHRLGVDDYDYGQGLATSGVGVSS